MRNHKKSLWSGSNDEITIIQLFPAIYIYNTDVIISHCGVAFQKEAFSQTINIDHI